MKFREVKPEQNQQPWVGITACQILTSVVIGYWPLGIGWWFCPGTPAIDFFHFMTTEF